MAEPLSLLIKSAFDATGITAATNSINRVDRQIQTVSKSVSKFMGLFAAGGVGASIVMWGKAAIDAYGEQQKAVSLLEKALDNLGITDRSVSRDLQEFANSLQMVSRATDEEILAAMTSLTQRGLYGEELKRATKASLDLATKTGSLADAANKVGMAFQGQTRGLNLLGIQLKANIDKGEVYAETMRQIQQNFGGAAQAEMDNYAGRVLILSKKFGELQESMGANLMPVAEKVLEWFEDLNVVMGYVIEKMPKLFPKSRADEIKGQIADITAELANLKSTSPINQLYQWATDNTAAKKTKLAALTEELRVLTAKSAPAGGSKVPTRAVGALVDTDQERVKAAEKAKRQAIADDKEYLREQMRSARAINDIKEFSLSEQGKMYTRYFGKIEMQRREDLALNAIYAEQLEMNNKQMLLQLERDYTEASHSLSGGFRQAVAEMSVSLWDFKAGFESVISSSIAPTQAALEDFFDISSKGFAKVGTLAEKTFKSIRDAFFDMIMQMIAKYLVFKMLTGMGLGGTAFGKFLGFATGGPIPGPEGHPIPIMAHGGEFMLSANVVKAIKDGKTTSGISSGGGARMGSGASIVQNITLNGGASDSDIGALCERISEATKNGLRQAGEMANVVTKIGSKKAGITGL